MSNVVIDPRAVLVDTLKLDLENFLTSNIILPNKKSIRAVYELSDLRGKLMEFARDAEIGVSMTPPPPKMPKMTDQMTEEEQQRIQIEYQELQKMYEDQKKSYTMHIPYGDYMMIENYLKKYTDTLHATSAIKGQRFFAFTKDTRPDEGGGFMGFIKKHNNNQNNA